MRISLWNEKAWQEMNLKKLTLWPDSEPMRLKLIFLLVFILLIPSLKAQKKQVDSTFACTFIQIHYGLTWPGGDLAERFGVNSNVGLSLSRKTSNNWIWGAGFDYIFGSQVREDNILDNISTSDGNIIDADGLYAEIYLYERGYQVSGKFGKIIPLDKLHLNSGLMLTAGAGYLTHRIRIENPGNLAPQVYGDYKKGYDRLSGGFSLNQYIGYVYFGQNKLANFFAGFEFTEAFTQELREYNFDTQAPGQEKRFDLLYGIRLGWIIPFQKKSGQVNYYY
jgi:hypothetical protein